MDNNSNGKNFQKKNPKKVNKQLAKYYYCNYCLFPIKKRKLIKCVNCSLRFCNDCLMLVDNYHVCPDCFFKWGKKNIKSMYVEKKINKQD